MSDIPGQLSLQAKLLQSIKDEITGLKLAFKTAEASRGNRFDNAMKKLRTEFDMDRLNAISANIISISDMVSLNGLRIQVIMEHLGLPDVEIED